MAAERHPHDAAEASEPNVEQEIPEEAPAGASDQDASRLGEEQRQRAGAAAAYAAAQGTAPQKPKSEADEQQGDEDGDQVQQDLDELAAKAEKADEYLMLAQRTQADFENYRKRAARDAALAQERGVAKLAKELLPAIDNLDRALKAASEEESPLTEGIKLVHTDLLSALQRVGVEPFSPDGEPFDPQFHEAVAQQPVDGAESGTVAEVFQQGFRLGDSVLRPARVLVAA
ncbi:MAG TPA: nucleotide exchange factor GrpE [Solirubrobacteraceae bacterium]|jgi:molecular chaperone GrpE|nr:nucleotide exchange factor GrpE [Solirubrobacteraceae bacterium]